MSLRKLQKKSPTLKRAEGTGTGEAAETGGRTKEETEPAGTEEIPKEETQAAGIRETAGAERLTAGTEKAARGIWTGGKRNAGKKSAGTETKEISKKEKLKREKRAEFMPLKSFYQKRNRNLRSCRNEG